jgi:hypothetical protein
MSLKLNIKKTKFMIFKRKNMCLNNLFYSIKFNDQTILSTTEYNYLGLLIDDNLTFCKHIQNVLRSITPYVGVLKKVRYCLNNKCLLSLYYAYIHSRLIYLLPIRSSSSNCNLRNVKYVVNKVMRT